MNGITPNGVSDNIPGRMWPDNGTVAAMQPGAFWAKITGNASGTNRYAWTQIDTGDTAAFDVGLSEEFAATGTSSADGAPAYEVNGRTDVATGTRVLLYPMGDLTYYGFAAPATEAAGAANYLAPARAATTANVNLSGGGIAAGTVHDGVTLAAGDRVFVCAQSSSPLNGVYVAPTSGAAARAADASTGAQLYGAVVPVVSGTEHGDSLWQCAANAVPTVDFDALPWVKIGPTDRSHVRVRAVVSHKVVAGALVNFDDATTWSSGVQNGSVWDGVTLATGDSILVTDLSGSAATNRAGLYRVQASGAPVRLFGFDTDASLYGLTVSVSEGALLAGSVYTSVIGTKSGSPTGADSASGGTRYFARVGRPWAGTVRFAVAASGSILGAVAGTGYDGVTAAEGDRYAVYGAGDGAGGVFVAQASGYTGSKVAALDCPGEYLKRGALVRVTSGTEYGGTTHFNTGTTWQFVGPAAHAWANVPLVGSITDISSLGGGPRQRVEVVEPLYLIDFAGLSLSGVGTRLYVAAATATGPGIVATDAQEFAGDKTFKDDVEIEGNLIGLGSAQFDGTVTAFDTLQTATGVNVSCGGIFRVANGGVLTDGVTGTLAPGMAVTGGIITSAGSGSFVGTADNNAFTGTNSFSNTTTFTGSLLSQSAGTFTPASSSTVPLTVKGAASQTTYLQRNEDSTGALLGGFDDDGVYRGPADFGEWTSPPPPPPPPPPPVSPPIPPPP